VLGKSSNFARGNRHMSRALGVSSPQFFRSKSTGQLLPSNHSPSFATDVDSALHTAITSEVAVLRNLIRSARDGR
jgi:hypothetical protein